MDIERVVYLPGMYSLALTNHAMFTREMISLITLFSITISLNHYWVENVGHEYAAWMVSWGGDQGALRPVPGDTDQGSRPGGEHGQHTTGNFKATAFKLGFTLASA